MNMNLGDPELELIDPTPNVHVLFLHFDKLFFWTKLASRAVVRWSKRMYSCAGICSYEGHGGLCDIALSEPLLKLRPRKDLIETLLHEMIHAFLFVTNRDRERDGHGPTFQSHMHRINNAAGVKITIYHDFHDEVELYLTHWWRCNGPCQTRKPYFGVVRKSQNRAPGPLDYWWASHQRSCGGTFVKIKEPEKKVKKTATKKPNADITKYIKNKNITDKNIKTIKDFPKDDRKPLTPLKKNSSNIPATSIKSNSGQTIVVSQKGGISSPENNKSPVPALFVGKGHTLNGGRKRSNSVDIAETVREKWAKKFTNTNNDSGKGKELVRTNTIYGTNISKTGKHKIPAQSNSPPMKMQKIDDYFKSTATTLLKDIYGQDFKITQSNNDNKIRAVPLKSNLVDCPICSSKIDSNEINRHLDECLNKDIIQELSQSASGVTQNPVPPGQPETKTFKEIVASPVSTLKNNTENYIPKIEKDFKNPHSSSNISIDLTNIQFGNVSVIKTEPIEEVVSLIFDPVDVNKVTSIVKNIHFDKNVRKSDNFIVPKEEANKADAKTGFLPSYLDDMATDIRLPPIKIVPGTSKDVIPSVKAQKCPCCGNKVNKSIAEHLEECLSFFDNNTTIPEEGASTSFANNTIVIDDEDDIFDETMTMNATRTKTPCPCCMKMIETDDMNSHLDDCLISN